MRGLGLDFTNPVGTGGVLDVCLYLGCGGVGGVGGEWVVVWTRVWRGGLVLCLCELWVRILCVDDRFMYLYNVLVGKHAHLRCTQCSILLHFMDICFLQCICLWKISQIQTCLCVVVGHGFVSTSPAFMRSSASHPAGPHSWLAKKVIRAPNAGGGRFRHNFL